MKRDILALGLRALGHRRQIHRDALILWNVLVGKRVEHGLRTGKNMHSQHAIDNRNGNPYLLRKQRQTIEYEKSYQNHQSAYPLKVINPAMVKEYVLATSEIAA